MGRVRQRISAFPSKLQPVRQTVVVPPAKEADPHYSDPKHLAWRTAVIERAGGVCEHPGCGRKERRMFADHIVELKDGGAPFEVSNGQCLCGQHHSIKTHRERDKRLSR